MPDTYIKREAEIMSKIACENVVKFLGFEQVSGLSWVEKVIAMEYCTEGDLQQMIDSKPHGFETAEFASFIRCLMNGLKHLTQMNIVHRDIKPLNIFVANGNGQRIFKLGDFGAARVLQKNETYGSLYGTPEYNHPDIFAAYNYPDLNMDRPRCVFNEKHDNWSVGICCFETATGRLPFNPIRGRKDPVKMYRMISEKQCDEISAQEADDGTIKWSKKLPDDCVMDTVMKRKVEVFLRGLLQVGEENMLSFDRIFDDAVYLLLPKETPTRKIQTAKKVKRAAPPPVTEPKKKRKVGNYWLRRRQH